MGGNKCNVPVCHHDQCGDGICARPSMCQCPDGSFKKSCNDEDPAHEVWDYQFNLRFRFLFKLGFKNSWTPSLFCPWRILD